MDMDMDMDMDTTEDIAAAATGAESAAERSATCYSPPCWKARRTVMS
jgi:hypothetical protein